MSWAVNVSGHHYTKDDAEAKIIEERVAMLAMEFVSKVSEVSNSGISYAVGSFQHLGPQNFLVPSEPMAPSD